MTADDAPLLPPDIRYLFFIRSGPPSLNGVEDNVAFQLVAVQGVPGEPDPDFIVPNARPIIQDGERSALITFWWQSYLACSVRAEHYAAVLDEDRTALMIERRDSAYLDFVRRTTSPDDLPPVLHHWELFCVHHRIDIVAEVMPRIHVDRPLGLHIDD